MNLIPSGMSRRHFLRHLAAGAATIPALDSWQFDSEAGRRIKQPVLYLVGGVSGPRIESAVARFVSFVPQTQVVTIPDARHNMPYRNPEAVADVIDAYLRSQSA